VEGKKEDGKSRVTCPCGNKHRSKWKQHQAQSGPVGLVNAPAHQKAMAGHKKHARIIHWARRRTDRSSPPGTRPLRP